MQYCGYAAGAVGIGFAVVVAFFTLPAWIPVVAALGVGLAFGAIGYCVGTKEYDDREAIIQRVQRQNAELTQNMQQMRAEMDKLASMEYKHHYPASPRGKAKAASAGNSSGSDSSNRNSKSDSKGSSPHTPPSPPSPRHQPTLFTLAQPQRQSPPSGSGAAVNDIKIHVPANDLRLDTPGLRISPMN
jgi:hypothetical protein